MFDCTWCWVAAWLLKTSLAPQGLTSCSFVLRVLCRMFTSLKALIVGEDLVSDPMGTMLSFVLHRVSHGSITIDVAQLSQVSLWGAWGRGGGQAGAGRAGQAGEGRGLGGRRGGKRGRDRVEMWA